MECYRVSSQPRSAGINEKTSQSTRRPPISSYARRRPSFTKPLRLATPWDRSFEGSTETERRPIPSSPSAHRETSWTERVARPCPLASARSQYPTLPRCGSAWSTAIQTCPRQAPLGSQTENVARVPRVQRALLRSNTSPAVCSNGPIHRTMSGSPIRRSIAGKSCSLGTRRATTPSLSGGSGIGSSTP